MFQNTTAAVSVLLDIIPVIGLAMLAVSFFRQRNKRRREEMRLVEKIVSWDHEGGKF